MIILELSCQSLNSVCMGLLYCLQDKLKYCALNWNKLLKFERKFSFVFTVHRFAGDFTNFNKWGQDYRRGLQIGVEIAFKIYTSRRILDFLGKIWISLWACLFSTSASLRGSALSLFILMDAWFFWELMGFVLRSRGISKKMLSMMMESVLNAFITIINVRSMFDYLLNTFSKHFLEM